MNEDVSSQGFETSWYWHSERLVELGICDGFCQSLHLGSLVYGNHIRFQKFRNESCRSCANFNRKIHVHVHLIILLKKVRDRVREHLHIL